MKFFDDVLSDETLNFYHKEFEIISQQQRWGLSDLNWSDNIKIGITGVCAYTSVSEQLKSMLKSDLVDVLPEYDDLGIRHYIWTRNSGISVHNDRGYVFGATIYLNKEWSVNDGGLFIYGDKMQNSFTPLYNSLCLNDDETNHLVTPVSPLSTQNRNTLQIWGLRKKTLDKSSVI